MTGNAYEADPSKVPQSDPYLGRSPFYGRYAPSPDDFVPRYTHWYASEPAAVEYWKEVVAKFCTREHCLNDPGPREAYAAGRVIIRIDRDPAEGASAERLSRLNVNEFLAAKKAEHVLSEIGVAVPVILFYGIIDGRNVTIETRIPGVSLQVAWRYLSPAEQQHFKGECREILRRLATVDRSPDVPSYVNPELNSASLPAVSDDERDILFEKRKPNEDLCFVHNDITRQNIIVNDGRVVGILGWRQSGFFGLDRAGRVHQLYRMPEHSTILNPGDDPAGQLAWSDLYGSLLVKAENNNDEHAAEVKPEPSVTQSIDRAPFSPPAPLTQTTQHAQPDGTDQIDEHATPKKVTDLKRESESRASSLDRSSPSAPSKSGASAKRSSSSSTKKGTATKKPPAKKRKIDNDTESVDERRSNTPSSSRATTKGSAAKKQGSSSLTGSPAPEQPKKGAKKGSRGASSAAPESEDDEDEDSTEVFCICRKPDNHTWMIGCDGGCEDWFHGKCVSIDPKDSELIDKYICPNCEAAGKGRTTWKRMCRLPECRKPARVSRHELSKYCSDEHGREFMRRLTQRITSSSKPQPSKTGRGAGQGRRSTKSRGWRSHSVDGEGDPNMETNDEEDDDDESRSRKFGIDPNEVGSRGGVLTPGDLRAAIMGVSSAAEFRRLGERLISPPPPPPAEEPVKQENHKEDPKSIYSNKLGLDVHPPSLAYSGDEEAKLERLRRRRDELLRRQTLLRAREQFINLVRQRAKSVLEQLKQREPKGGWKDICGYDSRLAWNDEEFDEWRQSERGQRALRENKLEAPEDDTTGVDNNHDAAEMMLDEQRHEPNGNGVHHPNKVKEEEEEEGEEGKGTEDAETHAFARGVCLKKRCERHKQWAKIHQQDVLFEQAMVREDLKRCEQEAQAVVERAVLRSWAERGES